MPKNTTGGKSTRKTTTRRSAAAGVIPDRASHPDKRLPVHNDPTHEIVCKWITAENEYQCRQVPAGGDWTLDA